MANALDRFLQYAVPADNNKMNLLQNQADAKRARQEKDEDWRKQITYQAKKEAEQKVQQLADIESKRKYDEAQDVARNEREDKENRFNTALKLGSSPETAAIGDKLMAAIPESEIPKQYLAFRQAFNPTQNQLVKDASVNNASGIVNVPALPEGVNNPFSSIASLGKANGQSKYAGGFGQTEQKQPDINSIIAKYMPVQQPQTILASDTGQPVMQENSFSTDTYGQTPGISFTDLVKDPKADKTRNDIDEYTAREINKTIASSGNGVTASEAGAKYISALNVTRLDRGLPAIDVDAGMLIPGLKAAAGIKKTEADTEYTVKGKLPLAQAKTLKINKADIPGALADIELTKEHIKTAQANRRNDVVKLTQAGQRISLTAQGLAQKQKQFDASLKQTALNNVNKQFAQKAKTDAQDISVQKAIASNLYIMNSKNDDDAKTDTRIKQAAKYNVSALYDKLSPKAKITDFMRNSKNNSKTEKIKALVKAARAKGASDDFIESTDEFRQGLELYRKNRGW